MVQDLTEVASTVITAAEVMQMECFLQDHQEVSRTQLAPDLQEAIREL